MKLKIKNHFILFIIFFGFITLSCAYYNILFNAKKSYRSGIEIIQKEPEKETHPQADKYFEATIDKCWKLIEIYSDKSKYADDALLYIIKSEFYLRKYAQAKSHANQFLLKYPKSDLIPEVNLWYGKLLLKDKQFDEGKDYLFRVINFASQSRLKAEAYYELGNLAYENKNYPEAIQYFEKALNEKTDKQYSAFIHFYLGESYFQQKQYKEAIKLYHKVEKFSPSLDVEYRTNFNLGKSYAELQEYNNALITFRKMLTAPRFKNFLSFINNEIATIYYRQKKIDEAVELYRSIVREKVSNAGTAQASLNLARIFEYDFKNIDSAVYYYGEVKKIFAKFENLEFAEDKFYFLSELKKLKDNISRDRTLVFKYENDRYFRDSLQTVQLEDSLFRLYNKPSTLPTDTALNKIDTSSYLYKKNIHQLDSLVKAISDSLVLLQNDTTRLKILEDSLKKINFYLQLKTPKKEIPVERRKISQIKEDLKISEYQLAEFFLLQTQEYDSAIVRYKKFLSTYSDSVLIPKAIYSLYYIYSQPGYADSVQRDSLANLLTTKYPNSPFARKLLMKEGDSKTETVSDSLEVLGHSLFLKAEESYFSNDLQQALRLYKQVAALDSNLIWSVKAQLARAWIFENDLKNIDSALAAYNELKTKFNQQEYLTYASMKVKPPPETLTSNTAVTADSAGALPGIGDTMLASTSIEQISNQPLPLQVATTSLPPISKIKEYREWRRNRLTKN